MNNDKESARESLLKLAQALKDGWGDATTEDFLEAVGR